MEYKMGSSDHEQFEMLAEFCGLKLPDEKYFESARECAACSTCAKTKTGAVIVKDGIIIGRGWNSCAPLGMEMMYGMPLDICAREGCPSGVGYELCGPRHAEIQACLNISPHLLLRPLRLRENRSVFASPNPWLNHIVQLFFGEAELRELNGATCYLVGHYYACGTCQRFLKCVGITDIRFDPVSAKETLDRYRAASRDER